MGYRIDYDGHKETESRRSGSSRLAVLMVSFFMLFVFLVASFWPEGREVLVRILIPGSPQTTFRAAETFADEIKNGDSLKDAATAFCQTVLHGEVTH